MIGKGRQGMARWSRARLGVERQAWRGKPWPGLERHGRQGRVRRGRVQPDLARQAWPGTAWRGKAWHGEARQARRGSAWNSRERSGMAFNLIIDDTHRLCQYVP